MKSIDIFTILQYSMQNDRIDIMISLLADLKIQTYDIIAIQEL